MHCSWPAPLCWQIASRRISFASGWLGVCTLHCPSPTNDLLHYMHQIHWRKSPAMGASLQSAQHWFCMVPLVAEIVSLEGWWGVSQVHLMEVQVEELCWKMLAHWLDCFPVVLDTLSVHLQKMAHVLGSAEGGTFETLHDHLGGGDILATVANNLNILGMHWWLVTNCVSCSMENGDKMGEGLEKTTKQVSTHMHMPDDMDCVKPTCDPRPDQSQCIQDTTVVLRSVPKTV